MRPSSVQGLRFKCRVESLMKEKPDKCPAGVWYRENCGCQHSRLSGLCRHALHNSALQ